MTLADACATFEALFAAVKADASHPGATAIVCSGAIGMPDHPPPVLCATEELAITLWHRCAWDYALEFCVLASEAKKRTLTWITEPQMLRFKMTIQDAMGAQRVATQRFAVYSVCAISEKPQDADPETAKPAVSTRRTRPPRQAKRRAPAGDAD